MYLVPIIIALGVALVFAARAFYRSFVRSQLDALGSDCANMHRMVGANAEAVEFVRQAEQHLRAARWHFKSGKLRQVQASMQEAYVALRSARLLVFPDPVDEDEEAQDTAANGEDR